MTDATEQRARRAHHRRALHTALLAAWCVLAALPGCLFRIDTSTRSSRDWETRPRRTALADARRETRQRLGRLALGMTREQVEQVMGTASLWVGDDIGWINAPYRTSSYRTAAGTDVVVLSYYTDIRRHDNVIDDDELTPVVLDDDRVIGWGRDFERPK